MVIVEVDRMQLLTTIWKYELAEQQINAGFQPTKVASYAVKRSVVSSINK